MCGHNRHPHSFATAPNFILEIVIYDLSRFHAGAPSLSDSLRYINNSNLAQLSWMSTAVAAYKKKIAFGTSHRQQCENTGNCCAAFSVAVSIQLASQSARRANAVTFALLNATGRFAASSPLPHKNIIMIIFRRRDSGAVALERVAPTLETFFHVRF